MRAFLLALAILSLPAAAAAQQVLRPGEPVEHTLAAGDAHAYRLDLDGHQFVLGDTDQHTVDVVVTLTGPDGERIQSFDRLVRGREPFQFTTGAAGTYTLTVTPYGGAEGRYTMRLARAEPIATAPAGIADQRLARYDDERSPGAAVAVVRGGEIVFEKGVGAANLEYGVPITPETVFYIGSVSKQFTAFAVAMLADQGRLSLDDEIRTFLPELTLGRPVTVRQLLHHTSGLRDTFGLLALAGGQDGDLVTQETLRDLLLRQRGLNFEPGTQFSYSNSNYVLLAEIVERVTGESFRSWMEANVFGPLGMSHTFVGDDHREIIPTRAASYAPEGSGFAAEISPFSAYGAGGIYSTVGDLARWIRNFRTAEVGGAAVARQMRERGVLANGDTLGYALGLFVDEHRGVARIQHSGALAGYRAVVAYYPEIDAGVVALGNVSSFNSGGVADDIAEAFFADAFEPERPPVVGGAEPARPDYDPASFEPETFDAFAGRYELTGAPGVVVRFRRDGGRYLVQVIGQPEEEIVPVGPSRFSTPDEEAEISFNASPDGSVGTITLHQDGDQQATRVPSEPETVVLADYVGRYYSDEVGTVYTIRVEDGGLVLAHSRMHTPIRLRHSAGGVFVGRYPVTGLSFERDANGTVTGFAAESVRTRGVRFDRMD